jgi:hypothetical protein
MKLFETKISKAEMDGFNSMKRRLAKRRCLSPRVQRLALEMKQKSEKSLSKQVKQNIVGEFVYKGRTFKIEEKHSPYGPRYWTGGWGPWESLEKMRKDIKETIDTETE